MERSRTQWFWGEVYLDRGGDGFVIVLEFLHRDVMELCANGFSSRERGCIKAERVLY